MASYCPASWLTDEVKWYPVHVRYKPLCFVLPSIYCATGRLSYFWIHVTISLLLVYSVTSLGSICLTHQKGQLAWMRNSHTMLYCWHTWPETRHIRWIRNTVHAFQKYIISSYIRINRQTSDTVTGPNNGLSPACTAPSHYLNQCRGHVNWAIRNIFCGILAYPFLNFHHLYDTMLKTSHDNDYLSRLWIILSCRWN